MLTVKCVSIEIEKHVLAAQISPSRLLRVCNQIPPRGRIPTYKHSRTNASAKRDRGWESRERGSKQQKGMLGGGRLTTHPERRLIAHTRMLSFLSSQRGNWSNHRLGMRIEKSLQKFWTKINVIYFSFILVHHFTRWQLWP